MNRQDTKVRTFLAGFFLLLQALSVGTCVSAAITLVKYYDYRDFLDPVSDGFINLAGLNPNDLFVRTEAMSWLAIVTAGIALLFGIAALVGRICDCTEKKSDNRKITTGYVSTFSFQ